MNNSKKILQVAVLVSGGGTNLQALIDAEKQMIADNGFCPYHIALVVSSAKDAYALTRAQNAGINSVVASPSVILGAENAKPASRDEKRLAVSDRVLQLCNENNIEVDYWTVNDASMSDELDRMGVHGVITDCPEMFIKS